MSDFNRDHNRAVWFDIPVVDLHRAVQFYQEVLAFEVAVHEFEGLKFGVLAHDQGNGGCLVPKPGEVASDSGILMYLNVHGRIRESVEKVKACGGKLLEDVHPIGPHGFRAIFRDSEGNRLALHSEVDA